MKLKQRKVDFVCDCPQGAEGFIAPLQERRDTSGAVLFLLCPYCGAVYEFCRITNRGLMLLNEINQLVEVGWSRKLVHLMELYKKEVFPI